MVQFPFPIRQFPAALQDIASEMETIFDHVLNSNNSNSASSKGCGNGGACEPTTATTMTPAMDVFEDEHSYELLLDLPGVSLESLKVELLEDKLNVTGAKAAATISEGTVRHRSERVSGNFVRSVRLPKQVASDQIEAKFKDGVLSIRVPKVPKSASRTIVVKG